jgi:CRP-like cAMP-binding protein
VYSVFRGLLKQQAAAVSAQLETVQVGAGEVIVRQGAPADKFFIILEGEVEVLREEGGSP